MITVAKTGRRTQISASFCIFGSLWSGGVQPAVNIRRAESTPLHLLQLRFHAREQSRPEPAVAIRELGLGEHRAGLGVDDAADGLHRADERLRRIRIDVRDD